MRKTTLIGVAATAAVATAAAAGTFQYLSGLAVKRISPKMPMPVLRRVSRDQQDDFFKETVETAKKHLEDFPHEELTLQSDDGNTLSALLYSSPTPKRVIVFMHGWRSSWQKDFGINIPRLLAMGSTILLADQRCHGKSEGKYITYGVKERFDCLLWVREMERRFPALPLYLWGVSMGATTVMLASALALPPQVRGVIADCGYTSPEEIMTHLLHKHTHLNAAFLTAVYREHFRRHFDFDIRGCSTLDALSKTKLPVLFFHGSEDDFVPVIMTRQNYAAVGGEKELVLIDKAAHGKCFFVDGDTCFQKVTLFFEKYDSPL